jgi:hypothetical protein
MSVETRNGFEPAAQGQLSKRRWQPESGIATLRRGYPPIRFCETNPFRFRTFSGASLSPREACAVCRRNYKWVRFGKRTQIMERAFWGAIGPNATSGKKMKLLDADAMGCGVIEIAELRLLLEEPLVSCEILRFAQNDRPRGRA